ncbi:MAG: UTP-glucose-1-phosphate uridylyltransferase (GalU) [uncultured bacterium]|nr:MAG: UTP-glucose-1-phosphate uridylyltransferase (GalU) [uncultured bacterium]
MIQVKKLIEKPGPINTPSNLATVSGFIFTPEIFDAIEEVQKDLPDGKELIYIDALNVMMKKNIPVYASEIKNGVYYDTGNKLEYLKTVIQFALKHKELNGEFRDYLKNLKV